MENESTDKPETKKDGKADTHIPKIGPSFPFPIILS